MILSNQKDLFTLPPDITFLNCAYMAPLLKSVNQAGVAAINKRNSPWEIKIDDWFKPGEHLRELFAAVIGGDKENIALIPSVSYGIAIAAANIALTAQQKIIVLDQQYPSNVYAWRELARRSGAEIITVNRKVDQNWTDAILEHINSSTGVVAVPNCHWTDGSLIDLEKVSKAVKPVGAKLIIDASQSLGVYPLDIAKIKPDFLITVGYKWLLGPYGLGYLYAAPEYCASGKPIEYSWLNKAGSEDFTRLADYTDEYKAGARRFDVGEFPNFTNIQMGIAALTQILTWGVANIQNTLSELTNAVEQKANEIGIETPKRETRVGHLIGLRFPGNQVAEVSKKLSDHQIYTSTRGTSMRVAPYLYNDMNDINRLFNYLS